MKSNITNESFTHIAFADESNWNQGRFRSICMISGEKETIIRLNNEIKNKLIESNIDEFKWRNFNSAKLRFAAEKIIYSLIPVCKNNLLRINILIWDIEDSRHKIKKRDDIANLARMYFHLFNNVLKNRWPDNAIWKLCPDKHNVIDWNKMHEILDYKSLSIDFPDLFNQNNFKYNIVLKKLYKIEIVEECESKDAHLIQTADLFAGMAWYSKEQYEKFFQWYRFCNDKQLIIKECVEELKLTSAQKERFKIMKLFYELCKKYKMGISYESSSSKCFRTEDPKRPVNFWLYKSLSDKDKAPRKISYVVTMSIC